MKDSKDKLEEFKNLDIPLKKNFLNSKGMQIQGFNG